MGQHNKHHKPAASHRGPTPQPAKPTPQTESAKDNFPKRGAWVRYKITATLLSDAHLGSGVGGQGLHALLARDSQNRPVIWSTHLEGLLREAARTLSGKPEGEREGEADRLFGKAGGSRQQMVFTSLYLVQKESPPSRVWRSTARESFDNRAPKGDTLRAIEFVPQCTVFEGQVELPETDVEQLKRLLQEVESIGHGRASGAGRVSLSLNKIDSSADGQGIFQQQRLRLLLKNLDPLCIAKTATPGNIIPTQPYIPGRTLLGALAAWLISEGTEQAKQAATLLVNGDVAVSDALPLKDKTSLDRLGPVEVLPAPLSLQSKKPEGQVGNVPWWATPKNAPIRLNSDKQKQDPNGEKLKRPEPDLFVQRIGSDQWETHRPDIRIRLRNGRPEPTQKDPSLFAIEQIAEDTQFLTELRGEDKALKALCAALQPVLSGIRWLRIGRSGAPVVVSRTSVPAQPGRQNTNNPVAGVSAYLTLTSDLLFRDDQLRWQTRLTQDTAQDLPGWPNGFSGTLTEEIFKPILQEETEIRGFNGTSGLWRLPAVGIRRGSVFKVNAALASELRKLASKGEWLGERTHEGFGRFRIDEEDKLPGVSQKTTSGETGSSPALRTGHDDDPSETVAYATKGWSESYKRNQGTPSLPRPSLSQWQDLVTELDLEKSAVPVPKESEALKSRRNPQTAGAAGWKHRAAQSILDGLENQPDRAQRAEYARMFVRWLRADRKKQGLEAAPAKREVAQ